VVNDEEVGVGVGAYSLWELEVLMSERIERMKRTKSAPVIVVQGKRRG
jgi:hypothetical protein